MIKNKIYNIDCEDGLKQMISDGDIVDGIITSPPYNIIRPAAPDMGYDKYKDGKPNDEYTAWIVKLFNLMEKILVKNGKILFNMSYGSENTECMSLTVADIIKYTDFTLADIIIWKKSTATPNNVSKNKLTRICEFVYVFCRKSEIKDFVTNKQCISYSKKNQPIYENIYNFIEAKNNDGSCPLNKATFSTDLVNQLIKIYFKKGDTVLDIFGGTGTTAVACQQNNINHISFELSKEQCEWANNRLIDSQYTDSQQSILDLL